MDLSRRRLLGTAGAGAAGLLAAGPGAAPAWAAPRFRSDPFRLGVASGDPHPDGFVLWTRLAPEPLAPDGRGGMPGRPVPVPWQVAGDAGFRRVVRRGTAHAVPELAHSVHVEVDGLEPGREYFYRFRAGSHFSPVGRARTAPRPRGTGRGAELAFAFASCQRWQDGFYTAYRHLAAEDLDFVVHLGDYLYESRIAPGAGVRGADLDPFLRREAYTLGEYRNRHALTKLDPDLQAAHRAFCWVMTWDDHEVENNWAGDTAQVDSDGFPDGDRASFRARKARAFQAYYEHAPLRLAQRPRGAEARMYRRLHFGTLLDLHVLDGRSHRTDQACGDMAGPGCTAERSDPSRTMLGRTQERWLSEGAGRSGATWNVLANQALVAQVDQDPDPGVRSFGFDMWDGYIAARDRLLTDLYERGAGNPVVLTGDIHRSVVADLRLDFDDEDSPVVATEFAGTSVSSGGDGAETDAVGADWTSPGVNPHLKWHNAQRGYTVCRVTHRAMRADYRVVPYVTSPGAPVGTAAGFVVEAGRPGAQPA